MKYNVLNKKCSICGKKPSLFWAEKNGCRVFRCSVCGFGFTWPLPSQRRLAKIYDKEYFRSYDPDDREHREEYLKRLEQYKLDAEYVSRYVKGGTVLDFGCGSGRYLEAMKGRLVKLGFEFNPSAVDRLKKARIDGFFTGDPFKMKVPGGLDLITMRGVIEHLIDPVRIAKFLCGKLKKKGYLIITATPNFDSPSALLYREKWNLFYPPEHLNYFSVRSLSVLFARCGLYCVDARYPYAETPYADIEKDKARWMNDMKHFLREGKVKNVSPPYPGNMLSVVFRRS